MNLRCGKCSSDVPGSTDVDGDWFSCLIKKLYQFKVTSRFSFFFLGFFPLLTHHLHFPSVISASFAQIFESSYGKAYVSRSFCTTLRDFLTSSSKVTSGQSSGFPYAASQFFSKGYDVEGLIFCATESPLPRCQIPLLFIWISPLLRLFHLQTLCAILMAFSQC